MLETEEHRSVGSEKQAEADMTTSSPRSTSIPRDEKVEDGKRAYSTHAKCHTDFYVYQQWMSVARERDENATSSTLVRALEIFEDG